MQSRLILTGIFILGTASLKAQIRYFEFMKKEPEIFSIKMAQSNKTNTPPLIDGVLDEEVWVTAYKMTGFRNTFLDDPIPDLQETTAWVTHDDQYLYFAFSCEDSEMDKIRAETFRYDDPDILFDDRIEILLDVAHDHKNLIRLAVNSNGITYDTRLERPVQYSVSYIKGDDRWNTEWRAKTRKYKDRWTAEVAIALDRIYTGKITSGTTWGFNIFRERHARFYYGPRLEKDARPAASQQLTAWQPVSGFAKGVYSDRFIEPNRYADLVFDQHILEVKELRFHEAYANYNGSIWHKPQFFGDNPLYIKLETHSEKPIDIRITTSAKNFDGLMTEVSSDHTLESGSVSEVKTVIPIRADDRQQFFMRISDKSDNSTLYYTSYDTRVPPFVEFDLSAVYTQSENTRGSIMFAPVVVPGTLDSCRLKLTLVRKDHSEELVSKEISNLKEYEFKPCFPDLDPGSLPSGNYAIVNRLIDKEGVIVGKFNHQFTVHRNIRRDKLSAADTTYSFGGKEGKAIVVSFPDGDRFVFWEHASYVPWWDLDNMAVTYEFMECWGYGNQGCSEPMQDKENRYSKVDIIENTPARAVVLWRYALGDPNYQIIFNEWVHEYYYLYPDGSGVREIRFWPNSEVIHEILQPQYVFPTGVIPEQMFEDTVCTIFNLQGDFTVNLLEKPVSEHPEHAKAWDEEIMRIYLKNRKHPYLVWSKREDIVPNAINNGLVMGDVRRSMGGHWPMQPMNVDVYSVVGTERPYHSWLGNIMVFPEPGKQPNRWIHLIGITDRNNDHLITLGKNWLNPASIRFTSKGFSFSEFDKIQKAYIFHREKASPKLAFSFSGVKEKTVHPVIIVGNCAQSVRSIRIGNETLKINDFESATFFKNEVPHRIIWINREIDPGVQVSIQFDRT